MRSIYALLFMASVLHGQTKQATAVNVASSATPTFTANSGNTIFRYILAQNVTSSTFSSPGVGTYIFRICQPGSGGPFTFAPFTGSAGMAAVPSGLNACLDQAASWDGTILRFLPATTGGTGDTMSPAINTAGFIPVWLGANSKTLGNGKAAPTGNILGDTDVQIVTNKTVNGVSPATMVFLDATSSIQTQLNGKGTTAGLTTVTFSTTPVFAATKTTVEMLKLTLSASTTSSTLTVASGNPRLILKVCENATGGFTHVWPANVLNAGAVDTTAHYCTAVSGTWDGANLISEFTTVTKDDGTRIGSAVGLNGSTSGMTSIIPAAVAGGTLIAPTRLAGATLATTTGTLVTNNYIKADVNGNLVDSTFAAGSGGGGGGTWGSITGTLSSQTDLNTALGLKAPALNAVFTGTFAVPAAVITPANMKASTVDVQTDAATVTWAIASVKDAQAKLTFTVHSGSRTLNITNPVIGGNYWIELIQDGTGGEQLILGTGCTWKIFNGGAHAVTLTNGANAIDILSFTYDGTNCIGGLNGNAN